MTTALIVGLVCVLSVAVGVGVGPRHARALGPRHRHLEASLGAGAGGGGGSVIFFLLWALVSFSPMEWYFLFGLNLPG